MKLLGGTYQDVVVLEDVAEFGVGGLIGAHCAAEDQ